MTRFSSLLGVLCLIFSSSMEAAILKFLQVNTALIPGNPFYGKKAIMPRLYGVFFRSVPVIMQYIWRWNHFGMPFVRD
jgi:hypothetical protein